MLTIHKPITLTADPSILKTSDNFSERITGNYQVMASRMSTEEMLHFIASPPEVYLAEGGMHSFIDMNTSYDSRETKLSIINNVLNRILVSDTYRMTYQDQVFISNMLQKIGITDTKEFMHQVQLMRQETKNIHKLIELYSSGGDLLYEIKQFRESRMEKKKNIPAEQEEKTSNPYYLHQDIFQRLHTQTIYQELNQYISNNQKASNVIMAKEMQISEQVMMAQNMVLNDLKNYVVEEAQPLIYNKINTYEIGDGTQLEENEIKISSELLQAVLLNILNQMYEIRYRELSVNRNVWYRLETAVYQATENTVRRFEEYHNSLSLSKEEVHEYVENVSRQQKNEIHVLNQLFENKSSVEEQKILIQQKNENLLVYRQSENGEEVEETESRLSEQKISQQNIYQNEKQIENIENLREENYEHLENIQKQQNELHVLNRFLENKSSIENLEAVTIRQNENLLLHQRIEAGEQENTQGELYGQNVVQQNVSQQNFYENVEQAEMVQKLSQEELIKQQLEIINQQNIENLNKLQKIEINSDVQAETGKINREKARADALRAIMNPQEVIQEYVTAKDGERELELIKHESYEKVFDEKTIAVFETLEKYRKTPELVHVPVMTDEEAREQLIRDIEQQNTEVVRERERNIKTNTRHVIREVEKQTILAENAAKQLNAVQKRSESTMTKVELFHKQSDIAINEEMLEEIRNINRSVNTETENRKETINVSNKMQEIVTTHVNEMQVQQNEEISRMISQNVKEQLGNLTEQVYGKLEKRMDTERRRRGL